MSHTYPMTPIHTFTWNIQSPPVHPAAHAQALPLMPPARLFPLPCEYFIDESYVVQAVTPVWTFLRFLFENEHHQYTESTLPPSSSSSSSPSPTPPPSRTMTPDLIPDVLPEFQALNDRENPWDSSPHDPVIENILHTFEKRRMPLRDTLRNN